MEMKAETCQMSCTLSLTEKELVMLTHLASYDVEDVLSNAIVRAYPIEQWRGLFSSMRSVCNATTNLFVDTRNVFIGVKKAVHR